MNVKFSAVKQRYVLHRPRKPLISRLYNAHTAVAAASQRVICNIQTVKRPD